MIENESWEKRIFIGWGSCCDINYIQLVANPMIRIELDVVMVAKFEVS